MNGKEFYIVTELTDQADYIETEVVGIFDDLEIARKFVEQTHSFKGWTDEDKLLTKEKFFEIEPGSISYAIEIHELNNSEDVLKMNETEPKVVCYYHRDMDGYAAACIVKTKYPNAEFISVQYGEDWDVNKIINSTCIIVDFSFPEMEDLKQYPNELIWIDHHKTAKETQRKVWEDERVKGLRRLDKSGCELAWEFFYPEEPAPKVIQLIGDYDTWTFKYGDETKNFNRGFYTIVDLETPNQNLIYFKEDELKSVITVGEIISDIKIGEVKQDFENGFVKEIIFNGNKYQTKVFNTVRNINELGNYTTSEKGFDIALIWWYKLNQIIVSLRSSEVDVSEIAKQHGGGGHKLAAGYFIEDKMKQIRFLGINNIIDLGKGELNEK
jgi:uncharacterized protein